MYKVELRLKKRYCIALLYRCQNLGQLVEIFFFFSLKTATVAQKTQDRERRPNLAGF